MATQAQVMNHVVLESARVSAVAECSPVLSLSAVLEDYWGNCECTGDRDDLHACHLPPSSRLQQDASPGLKTASNIVCTRKRTVGGAFEAAPSLDDIQQPQQPQQQAQQLRQVALLKVDVEGDELEVLWSLRAVHWACIDRVIVEAALHLQHPIIDLLIYSGFPRDAISTDGGVPGSYTGNVIIFASKFT